MSYSTVFTDDYMGIHHAGKGLVTGAEILEACRATTQLLQNTENFHYELIDFTEVTDLQISEDELTRIIAQDFYAAIFRPDAVVVIVAPRDEHFATARAWEQRIRGIGWLTHVARERGEAERWLHEHYPHPETARVDDAPAGSEPADSANLA